jgi:hypothetical protein
LPKKTVYVVGAGASYEANLPTGNELKGQIADLLNMKFGRATQISGDHQIEQALRHHTDEDSSLKLLNSYIHECRHISENMPLAISIDNFIDSERGNEKLALCGKLAIVKSILEAERNSTLYVDRLRPERGFNFSSLENTWYLSFFRTLTENCSKEDLIPRFESITLIIFNYDRCIEHFLAHALMSYYRLDIQRAAELVNSLKIIHPYGTVGSLEWQGSGSSTTVVFGGELHASRLVDHAERIRTFTEGAHSKYMNSLINSMQYTERLIFLGFAFHRLNMDLIGGENTDGYENTNTVECYATAYETSTSDQVSIKNSINYLYKYPVSTNIENSTCTQLFKDYSRSLGYSQ